MAPLPSASPHGQAANSSNSNGVTTSAVPSLSLDVVPLTPQDVLVLATRVLHQLVAPRALPSSSSSTKSRGLTTVDAALLLAATHRPVAQQGAPPDWARVPIADLSAWPELEALVAKIDAAPVVAADKDAVGASGAVELDDGGDIDDDEDDDDEEEGGGGGGSGIGIGSSTREIPTVPWSPSSSDITVSRPTVSTAKDHASAKSKASVSQTTPSDAGAAAASSSSSSMPRSPVNSRLRGSTTLTALAPTSRAAASVTMPRGCSADAVLGTLVFLEDTALDKVRLHVDAELAQMPAGRRATSAGRNGAGLEDALPALASGGAPGTRPGTAPEGDAPTPSAVEKAKSRKLSTLSMVRQEAAADATSSSSSIVTTTSPSAASPGRNGGGGGLTTPKRKSRSSMVLEPLASPSGASLSPSHHRNSSS
ncbi:hypothetical protein PINS_up012769 [Pythium insidiosum]|nr:hypothetical protein PINS_up012769 [Pythium insidiosum]